MFAEYVLYKKHDNIFYCYIKRDWNLLFYSNYLKMAVTQSMPSMPSIPSIPSMPSMPSIPPLFMMSSRAANSDVLEDPYAPPLRNDSYFGGIGPNMMMPMAAGIPINIRTQGPPVNTNYRQVGLLTRINGKETMLPLMGRPLQKIETSGSFTP